LLERQYESIHSFYIIARDRLYFVVGVVRIGPPHPPRPVPASASLEGFSAERAMSHVRAPSQSPRVVEAPKMGKTADYLFAPNLVLAFLSTGMETLVLVNILVILNVESWTWNEL
jgi:hypothetical protein